MPPKTKTEELTKMSRRRFTEALAGLGLSAGVVNYMTQNALAEQTEDPRDEVPRLYSRRLKNPDQWNGREEDGEPEMEEIWYTIPRSQWVRVETAQNACRELHKELKELEPSGLLAVGVKSEYNRDRSEKRLVVEHTTVQRQVGEDEYETVAEPSVSFEKVEEETPYTVTGVVGEGDNREEREIEVSVERVTETEVSCGVTSDDYYDHYYDDCPGGARIDNDNDVCTSTAPGWHSSHGTVIVTTGHCFWVGDAINQPHSDYLGSVQERVYWDDDPDHSWPCDGLYLDIGSSRGYRYYLASDDGDNQYDEQMSGQLYWNAITDMEDSAFDQMEKQGITTGRCAGDVIGTYSNYDVNWFEVDTLVEDGDSGGPNFVINSDGDAELGGITRAEYNNNVRSNYLNDQYDHLGVTFL